MRTRTSEGALISYDEMEHRMHHARQVRAEILGGSIRDLLSAFGSAAVRADVRSHIAAPLRQLKLLIPTVRFRAPAVTLPLAGGADVTTLTPRRPL